MRCLLRNDETDSNYVWYRCRLCGLFIPRGLINFQPVLDAKWFELPELANQNLNLEAILYMLPIAITSRWNVGGIIMAISSVTE